MDIVTYALCQAYVRKTAEGLGAVRGKPCTIQSITDIDNGHLVTFRWTGDSGTVQTTQMLVKDGEQGISITNANINANNHLIFTFSDGSTIDAGAITVTDKFPESFVTTESQGSINSGQTISTNTPVWKVVKDMLVKYQPPTVVLSTTPATKLYDIINDSISTILLKGAVTKKSKPVTKVSFYVGDTLLNEVTTGVADGGNFQYQYTPAIPIKTDVTFKATATDGQQSTNSSVTIKFVGKSYYGICDASVSDPDETVIKSGSSVLKDTKAYTYSGINMEYNKVFYAYPKSFGELSKIVDPVNNLQYLNDFQKSIQTVDGLEYVVYCQKQPSRSVDVTLQFI